MPWPSARAHNLVKTGGCRGVSTPRQHDDRDRDRDGDGDGDGDGDAIRDHGLKALVVTLPEEFVRTRKPSGTLRPAGFAARR
jgi:hypothetical protein